MQELSTPIATQEGYKQVTTLLGCFFLLQCLDDIENEKYFRQQLKFHGKNLKKELELICNYGFGYLSKEDYETLNEVLSSSEKIITLLAKTNPNHLPVIETLIETYLEKPDETLEAINLKVFQK